MFGPLGAEKYHEYCNDIRTSGQYLLEVINDIPDMSRIEAGRQRIHWDTRRSQPHPARLAARPVRPRPGQGRRADDAYRRECVVCGRPARGQAGAAQSAEQRAVKFTPEGGGDGARRGYSTRPHVHLDQGYRHRHPGRGTQRRLAARSNRSKASSPKTYPGSGLGLAIAKSLVNLHGGSMRIRSSVGVRHHRRGAHAAEQASRGKFERGCRVVRL